MTALLPELSSVRLRETESALVLEVDVPDDVELSRLSARIHGGVLTITVPRTPPARHLAGFHPDVPPD